MSNYPFVAGLIWAEEKEKIDKILENRWCLCMITATTLFAVFSAVPLLTEKFGLTNDTVYIVCRMVSTTVLAVLCVVILNKVWIKGYLWRFLGGISLEIYIIHGLIIMVLRSDVIYVQSDVLWTILTVVISIGTAYVASLMNKQIGKIMRN